MPEQTNKSQPTLDELLETWSVFDLDEESKESSLREWYAVTNDSGIVAYFLNENDAYRFRLDQINRILNP